MIKVLGLVSPEPSLPGLQITLFLLCPHVAFSLGVHIPGVSSSSYMDTNPNGLRPHPYDLIYLS